MYSTKKRICLTGQDLDTEKLLGIRDVYMKTVMSSNYRGDIFYTRDQVRLSLTKGRVISWRG